MARKSAYDTIIKPNFEMIENALQNGATEKQVYDSLGISRETFYKYKRSKDDFAEVIKKGRAKLVGELRGTLIKKAFGFGYTEKKIVKYQTEDGEEQTRVEIYERKSLPDVAALNLCLKNYDRDDWANDPQMLELKKQELEIKKQNAEAQNW